MLQNLDSVDEDLVKVLDLVKVIPKGDFRSLQRNLSDLVYYIVDFLVPFGRDEPYFLYPAYQGGEPSIDTYLEGHWRRLRRSGFAVELQAKVLQGEVIHPLNEKANKMLAELQRVDAATDPTWLKEYLTTKVRGSL